MAQTVVADTFEHEQTGKIHLVDVYFASQMWHCYCSFVKHTEPTEREVDLDNPDVCSTCAAGYREEHGDVSDEEKNDPRTTSNDNKESALTSDSDSSEESASNTALASTETALDN